MGRSETKVRKRDEKEEVPREREKERPKRGNRKKNTISKKQNKEDIGKLPKRRTEL